MYAFILNLHVLELALGSIPNVGIEHIFTFEQEIEIINKENEPFVRPSMKVTVSCKYIILVYKKR